VPPFFIVTVGVVVLVGVEVPVLTGGLMEGVVVVVVVVDDFVPHPVTRRITTMRIARGMNSFFISAPFKILCCLTNGDYSNNKPNLKKKEIPVNKA
jgi:hypothetical protein